MNELEIINKVNKVPKDTTLDIQIIQNELLDIEKIKSDISGVKRTIEFLKTSVSDGKDLIASSITDRGINTSNEATFKTMSDNILKLEKYIGELIISDVSVVEVYSEGKYKITYTIVNANGRNIKHELKIENNDWFVITPTNSNYTYTYNGEGLRSDTRYNCTLKISNVSTTESVEKNFTIAIPKQMVYGVRVDESNSNPSTSVTYIEGSVGIDVATPTTYGGWKDKYPFNKIKPCGFKNGQVFKYINPNDFTKYEDGTSVGTDVDVMIEFPKLYWKFTTITNGYEIRMSEIKPDNNYICPAHTIGTKEVDKIYIGAYAGYSENDKLRSKANVYPTNSKSLTACRTYAQANGLGYQQFNYYSLLMLQILYLIMYKNLDSQSALGRGWTENNNNTIMTGGTTKKGMIFGENTGKFEMKFLGIESLWGNISQWIDGYCFNSSRKMMISNNSVFNDNGYNYEDCGQGNTDNTEGYVRTCQAGTKTGFVIKNYGGSTNINYCDYGSLKSGCSIVFGGHYQNTLLSGMFNLDISFTYSFYSSQIGSRLVYIGY